MTRKNDSDFTPFVPGFDFLQSLAKGAASGWPQMPALAAWVSPSLNLEDLDKRIGELKAVHFWLEQNGKALSATIQALEVQKMTLATLKGMNLDVATEPTLHKSGSATSRTVPGQGAVVDPMQLWGSLAQQFQQIAAAAMKEAVQLPAAKKGTRRATRK